MKSEFEGQNITAMLKFLDEGILIANNNIICLHSFSHSTKKFKLRFETPISKSDIISNILMIDQERYALCSKKKCLCSANQTWELW